MNRLIALLSSLTLWSLVTAASRPLARTPAIRATSTRLPRRRGALPRRPDRPHRPTKPSSAVSDARTTHSCFFPKAPTLSPRPSCEQQVRKLNAPRYTDGETQHYWDLSPRRAFGSTGGNVPCLLSKDAKASMIRRIRRLPSDLGTDPSRRPGRAGTELGRRAVNISFNTSSAASTSTSVGMPGHRYPPPGSQGSALLDSTILAEKPTPA